MGRIYTRTGDEGDTSLGDGTRSSKAAGRIDLYGDVDELNSVLGCCLANLEGATAPAGLVAELASLQSRLFDLGAVLADPGRSAEIAAEPVARQPFDPGPLEKAIDELDQGLEPLRNFIMPGGGAAAAFLHLARTVCRRAERKAVALAATEPVPARAIVYLNRLSDLLFTAARAANAAEGRGDVPWVPDEEGS